VLVGRIEERAAIDQALDDARSGRGRALVILGEAGIGKSTLLDYARAEAKEMTVVRVRPLESDTEVAFTGLADVYRPLTPLLDAIPEQHALTLRAALGLEAADARPERLALGVATLALLAAAGERQPLLLAVDDAQWLDGESASALVFAARRLEAEAVAAIFAARQVGSSFAGHGLEQLQLGGLDVGAARALLEEVAPAEFAPDVAERLVQSTRGNPLALIELPRTLTAAQLRGDEPLQEPLPVGPDVERAFAHRATRLGEDARRALLIAAASDTSDLGPVVDAAERMGLGRSALETAEDEGLLSLEGASFEFRHPLVRSAVYYGAAASERRSAHRALAEALAGADEERVAWHRATAALAPDEEAALLLEDAGTRSTERGAYSSAAAAIERAARLGDAGRLVDRLARAADAAWLGGDPEKATSLVEEGLRAEPPASLRADLIGLRARIELHSGNQEQAYRWFLEAADLVEEDEPERAAEMLAEAIAAGGQLGAPRLREAAARAARLPHGDDPVFELVFAQALGAATSISGQGDGTAMLRESLSTLDAVAGRATSPLHLLWAGRGYFMLGRNSDASAVARKALQQARDGQATGLLPQLLRLLAAADYDRGEWVSTRGAAAEGAELAEELGQTTTACACLGLLSELEAALGAEEDCRGHAGRAIEIATQAGLGFYRERAERALGRLDFALGRLDGAAELLERAAERLERDGNREMNVSPLEDLVEVNVRRGDADGAERALERLEVIAASPMPNEEAILERCRGLVAADDGFEAHFERALDRHAADLFPFELARTELCYGERLRRIGERLAARDHLRAAAETFRALGADPWLERTEDELRASGERLRARDPGELDRLTPREAQIAAEVAEGKSNRDVAAALYLTPKTVEFHLTRIYRKVGVASRAELVSRMSKDFATGSGPE